MRRHYRCGGRILGLLCLAICGSIGVQEAAAGQTPTIQQLIQRAGNDDDDSRRLEILKKLQKMPGLDQKLEADVDRLVAAVDEWVTSKRLTYYSREVYRTGDFDLKIDRGSPLYPVGCIYRARMIVSVILESGNYKGRARPYLDRAVGLFKIAKAAFPENRIVRMYLGEPIPAARQYPGVPGAPEWAVLQREGLERMADIVEWWIDHRMQDDGQYGGGWGDDCEMWRCWVPVLIAFDDPKITAAQARFSNAMMNQPHMQGGYTSRMSDVEHTAEDSADVITPMMHLRPDDPLWNNRARRLAELMETLWTGRNERGLLQFKSTYFTVDRVDRNPQRACDSVYHPRAVQPALLLWQRTADKKLAKLFTAWMDTWVDAAARTEQGKPAGIIPSAIHWPDGVVGGLGRDWWDPRNHGEARLYFWPSAMSMMTNSLLLTYHMTGDQKYLQPLRSMGAVRLKWLQGRSGSPDKPGSEAWCAHRLGGLSATLAKYKLLTRSTEFDELLARDHRTFMLSESPDDRTLLVAALQETAEALRINFPGYTSEVRFTDRVTRFPALFGKNMMFSKAVPAIKRPNTSFLYSTATGDPGDCFYFPLAAVRWLTPPREIAALVTASGTDRFTAELFHFGKAKRPMSAELYLLAPGRYMLQLIEPDRPGSANPPTPLSVTGPRTRISFELPPGKLCMLKVLPEKGKHQ